MIYKEKSSGRTMDVLETDAAKRRILERSGWFAVPEAEQPQAPAAEVPPVEVPEAEQPQAPAAEVPPVEVPEVEQPVPVDDLPEDFPERQLLTDAGYGALLLVSKATDDELRAIDGIGKGKLKAIRDYAIHQ